MMASRGMGAISASKMPKGKTKKRRDDTDFEQFKKGGKIKKFGVGGKANPTDKNTPILEGTSGGSGGSFSTSSAPAQYRVWDTHANSLVRGKAYDSLSSANKAVDRLDNEYGGSRYTVKNLSDTSYKKGGATNHPGLYANIHAKQARIAAGSGEHMRKPGSKGAPSKADFIKSAKTRKKK